MRYCGATQLPSGSDRCLRNALKRETIIVDPRFHGPADSANGGYVCGCLARFVNSPAVTVRLKVPPPLAKAMEVRDSLDGVALFADEIMVAEAKPSTFTLKPVVPPSYAEALAASRQYRGFDFHWYPSCFVCGPDREENDGLRIFPGPIEGRDEIACPWIPDASLAGSNGLVSSEFLWAALDCPGAYTFPPPAEGAILLGQLQVQLLGDVAVGEHCVLVAWQIAHEGRKHHTATALFGESGECRGLGQGIWIEVA